MKSWSVCLTLLAVLLILLVCAVAAPAQYNHGYGYGHYGSYSYYSYPYYNYYGSYSYPYYNSNYCYPSTTTKTVVQPVLAPPDTAALVREVLRQQAAQGIQNMPPLPAPTATAPAVPPSTAAPLTPEELAKLRQLLQRQQ